MTTKRILVVDDSALMRRLVKHAVESDPDLRVCGTAFSGVSALAQIEQMSPDLITLDIEMPQMDGLATLSHLRKRWPQLPVVICSSLTERGASTTLEALSRGADDYIPKPASGLTLESNLKQFGIDLTGKIRPLLRLPAAGSADTPPAAPTRPVLPARQHTVQSDISLLVIGSSTGGPNALDEVLAQLPADFPVPVLIAQHMPPLFTRLLAERLDARCSLRVREGIEGSPLTPGTVWIAPGDHHMRVVCEAGVPTLRLDQKPPVNFCRPAVDALLESAVECYGAGVLAVILTGMGRDGCNGCRTLYVQGGSVYAQDEASSVVWGMPGAVVNDGLAERVLPLSEIGSAILARAARTVNRATRYAV
ncbi:MAG: protein-glutamate methylesterase/protein-glutamine glutaminase [Immundisolibacter sp.]|uniref:protein-glutamate methylesterase/protein-glutamine glutaminase n=1 Tax=Immundisolibacter sp. TaxID=1934948 RepID=UPI003EE00389